MRVVVRRASPDDALAIAQIHVRTWQVAYRGLVPDQVLEALSVEQREQFWREATAGAQGAVYVATADGDVCGFCAIGMPSRDEDADEGVAEVGAIYVEPTAWRSGIGTALMEAALGDLRGNGWRHVTLWVLEENRPARDFYTRWGFEPDGGVMRHEDSGQTEIRLRTSVRA